MQKTDFPFELIISEDCSTDGTLAICKKYADLYPNIIRLLHNEKNLGPAFNGIRILRACHGKYIAPLDGDDYWNDPHKLQKQVKVMETHPDCALVCHPVRVINEDTATRVEERFDGIDHPKDQKDFYTINDIIKKNFIRTGSVIAFRRSSLPDTWPNIHAKSPASVTAMVILLAQHGNIRYLPDAMTTYRIHSGGIWSSANQNLNLKRCIATLIVLKEYFDNTAQANLLVESIRSVLLTATDNVVWGEDIKHGRYACLLASRQGFFPFRSFNHCLRALLWITLPGIMKKLSNMLNRKKGIQSALKK